MTFVAVGSDRLSELIERGSHPELSVDHVNAEFVVAAPQVLDERVPADHDAGRPIGLQAAHRSQPGLQSSVVPLDPLGPTPEGRIIHRKIFSCFRDQTGAERFATVRSYLSTTRKHDIPAIDALTRLFNKTPGYQPPPPPPDGT